jgi:5-methylcytosine-specific restriction enzyme B
MAQLTLTAAEQLALSRVLELQLSVTRKGTPLLLPLSFYTSELKGTKQIAALLTAVRNGEPLSENEVSRARYFNTLSNQGLLHGTAASPVLTPTAQYYLQAVDAGADDEFWRGDGGNSVELEVIRILVEQMSGGTPVSDVAKAIWFNVQSFFDQMPPEEWDGVLSDRDRLLFLFRINSAGWEIARYFRLSTSQRGEFDKAFAKVLPSDEWSPKAPIDVAAAQYKDAAEVIQSDVRFRISGFTNAYRKLRDELGPELPRLDRLLEMKKGVQAVTPFGSLTAKNVTPSTATALTHPRQLIVTGCPGSGKSYYVGGLINSEKCAVFRTQFHPESSYFDFVGAYKPQPIYELPNESSPLQEGDGSKYSRGRPLIDYRFAPGPLMRALLYAYTRPAENVIVLIEELNRGNPAAILGDMLQLLDRDDTGKSRYSVIATPEIQSYFLMHGVSVESVYLPANLYMWATMNSADQGVFPLDSAFRRRWSYVYKGYTEPCLYPATSARITYGGQQYAWDDFRGAINQRLIDLGIHEDKLIGPYFLTVEQLASPTSVLEKLLLYLWDDVLRFRQDNIFVAKSFSLVASAWANGSGTPMSLTLPAPLETSPQTPGPEKVPTSASE